MKGRTTKRKNGGKKGKYWSDRECVVERKREGGEKSKYNYEINVFISENV